jgi:hypothetical protein
MQIEEVLGFFYEIQLQTQTLIYTSAHSPLLDIDGHVLREREKVKVFDSYNWIPLHQP